MIRKQIQIEETFSAFRKYEYTRETLLKFKENYEAEQKAGNKAQGQGGFGGGGGGFGGGAAAEKVRNCTIRNQ